MKVTLNDLCHSIIDCEHKTAPRAKSGHPSIRTPNIGKGYFKLEGVYLVSEETYQKWTRRGKPETGDLILAREAPVGNVAMVPKGLKPCLGQRTVLIKPRRELVDARYLTYLLLGNEVQGHIHSQTNGATVAHLNMRDIRALPISLPSLPEQKRIAGILSAYDDLIENNLRRIKILEEMAQSLYREWFVHFRFPGHESVKMVDSSLGQIPEGWEVKKLGEIAEDVRRAVPKGKLNEPTPYVGLEHIPRKSLALDDWDVVSELGSNKLIFKPGEILFGKIRPYFHKVSVAPFEGICSADTIVIRAKESKNRAMVTACASSVPFVAHASATSNGAKMPRANWKVLVNYPVVEPPKTLKENFSTFYCNAVSEQQVMIRRSQILRKTRDLLLPKLLSADCNAHE